MTRSGSKDSLAWVLQVVHVTEPPIDSPAALALLAKKYYSLDKDIFSERRMSRLRNKWMKQQMKYPDELGGLTCAICGRKGLLPHADDLDNKATLDHVVEIYKGGSWRDPYNFQVACYKCNAQKNIILHKSQSPNLTKQIQAMRKKHLTPDYEWCKI